MMSNRSVRGRAFRLAAVTCAMVVLALASTARAQELSPTGTDPWDDRVDQLREDLVQLRLEKVLADSDTVLREAGLQEDARTEVWILRSQAHVALGDLDAAARDFEEILRARPGFEPEPTLMTPAATKRFDALRKRMIGTLRIEVTPRDARVVVDGRPRTPSASKAVVAVLAGQRDVRIERPGHDAWSEAVTVEPGKEVFLQVRLVPNARTVTFVTDEPEVAIEVDGREIGRTASRVTDVGSGMRATAVLTVENVPLGEHVFTYVKACFRTVRRTERLNIDILDPVPLTLPSVKMEAAFATLAITGEPSGTRVRVDDEFVGTAPAEAIRICPGERVVDVERDGTLLYRTEIEVTDGVSVRIEFAPRPNVALVGVRSFPVGFEAMAKTFNIAERRIVPDAPSDLETTAGWERLGLARDVHLGLAVLAPGGPGEPARRLLYSPILGTVTRLDVAPVRPGRPSWTVNAIGAVVVDSRIGGPARVAAVRREGPADRSGLRVGDRIVAVDDVVVPGAAAFRRAVEDSDPGATLGLRVQGVDGTNRELPLVGVASPRIADPATEPGGAAIRAAWAHQHAFAFPTDAAAALANLARLLEDSGREQRALATWRRVRWPDREGIGPGTVAYQIGRLSLAEGREDEAATAFREAASSRATARYDDGPAIAPAARDYLADLGVVVDDN